MIEYIIVAILQGLFEWLPISSSGQVMIVAINFLGISPEKAFSLAIFLHLGTTLAVLVRFRSEFILIIKAFLPGTFQSEEKDIKLRNWLIIATIGTAITALPLYFFFRYMLVEGFSAAQGDIITLIISGLLIFTGILLLIGKKAFGDKKLETIESPSVNKNSVIAGLTQGISILPGVSRSGVTVTTILFEKFEQEQALKLSFLMSVPAAIASIGVDVLFGEGSVFGVLDLTTIVVITGVSFLVGLLSMEALLKVARRMEFGIFCILYGIIAFAVIIPFLVLN